MDDERSKYAPRLIFATKCARRVALLKSTGVPFIHAEPPPSAPSEVTPIERVDRKFWGPRDEVIHDHAAQIALRKAQRLAAHGHWRIDQGAHTIVLASKTMLFDHRDEPVGVPQSRDDAEAMLGDLVAHGHRLVTGCAYFQPDSRLDETLADTVDVSCEPIDDEALATYLDNEMWRDLVGGYGRLGETPALPLSFEGDITCVQGLPLTALRATFENWSLRPPDDWSPDDSNT